MHLLQFILKGYESQAFILLSQILLTFGVQQGLILDPLLKTSLEGRHIVR